MKKIAFILLIISVIACETKSKADYAVISGTITNISNTTPLSINALDRSFNKKLEVFGEGQFTDTIKSDTRDYVLYDGKNPVFLYIQPGDEIIINYDLKDFDKTLSISGNGAEISKYLKGKRAIETKHLAGGNAQLFKLDENAFKELFDKIADEQINLLETTARIPEDYKAKEIRNINYFYLTLLKNYEASHRRQTGNNAFKVSAGFLTELETIEYDNAEDYEFSIYYKQLVNNHLSVKLQEVSKTKNLSTGLALIDILKEMSSPKLTNTVLFDFAKGNLARERNIKEFYDAYIQTSTNQKHKDEITAIYEKLNSTNPGKLSPKFINYENYAGETTSLDDLKGKYVYIDIWATWCRPCINEFPALKKLEAEFHDKNIKFVSISVDNGRGYKDNSLEASKEGWKKMIEEKELGGIQLLADKAWNSDFIKSYQIQSIPRFILLDPEGKIVNSNAPRPSNPELKILLESLDI